MHNIAGKVRSELDKNINKKDHEWLHLYQAFVDLLHKHNIDPNAESIDTMKFESEKLKQIFDQIRELNRKNSMLIAKFEGDRKFAVVYKNIQPSGKVSDNMPLYNLLCNAKNKIDTRLGQNQNLLSNSGYFRQATGEDILESFQTGKYEVDSSIVKSLIAYTADEYLKEYQGE